MKSLKPELKISYEADIQRYHVNCIGSYRIVADRLTKKKIESLLSEYYWKESEAIKALNTINELWI